MTTRPSDFLLSVIIPVYNEAGNITQLCRELFTVLKTIPRNEIIFVDDGSTDTTLSVIKTLKRQHHNLHYVSLSKNFGHQNALKAGLDFSNGDVVITMDGDLQHPPPLIPQMIKNWRSGYDIVTTRREPSKQSHFLKQFSSDAFYTLFTKATTITLHPGKADFRLIDKKVARILRQFNERDIFYRGFIAWIGFKQCELAYAPQKRGAGTTKYTFAKMARLACSGLLGFSILPLRLVALAGLLISSVSFAYGFYAICVKIFTDQAVSGWASVMTGVYFLGGIQLLSLGICGEYIGRVFMQVKNRPLYIVADSSLPGPASNDRQKGACDEQ
jgi:glycosyltransferase involved in cell wall biosynthesis